MFAGGALAHEFLCLRPRPDAGRLAGTSAAAVVGAASSSNSAPRDLPREPPAGLPARMVVAAVSVVVITAAASLLGPAVGGMLAPLPVLAAVMATSSHRRGARGQAQGLLRGAVVGSWGGVAFFAVVAIMLPLEAPRVTYCAATLAALAAGAIAMAVREHSDAVVPAWMGVSAS